MGVRNPSVLSPMHVLARRLARERGDIRFFGDPCRHGHDGPRFTSNGRCVACASTSKAKRDPEARRAAERKYRAEHLEKARARDRARYVPRPKPPALSSAERAERRRAYNARPEVKARRNARLRRRYQADPTARLKVRMRQAVHQSLRAAGNGKQRARWCDLVGYGVGELRRHLERQFLPGMSWHNIGHWHIDHIVPIASFGPMSPGDERFLACWALTNLRPLWKSENLRKSAKRELLL